MPGTPPTTPNLGIPRYADTDAASFSAQLNAVSDRVDLVVVKNTDPRLSDQRTPLDGSVTDAKIAPATITTDKLAWPGTVLQSGDVIWSPVATRVGCLECTGQAVSRTTYAALYAALGGASSPWGQGDGSTTFNVPDLRGCTLIGAGQKPGLTNRNVGDYIGEESHTLSTGELPSHNHGINDPGHSHGLNGPPTNIYGNDFGSHATNAGSGGWGLNWGTLSVASSGTGISVQNTGSGWGHNNIQPSVAGRWFIKT